MSWSVAFTVKAGATVADKVRERFAETNYLVGKTEKALKVQAGEMAVLAIAGMDPGMLVRVEASGSAWVENPDTEAEHSKQQVIKLSVEPIYGEIVE